MVHHPSGGSVSKAGSLLTSVFHMISIFSDFKKTVIPISVLGMDFL